MFCSPLCGKKPLLSQLYGGCGNFRMFSPPKPGHDVAHNLGIMVPKMVTAVHNSSQGELGFFPSRTSPTVCSS